MFDDEWLQCMKEEEREKLKQLKLEERENLKQLREKLEEREKAEWELQRKQDVKWFNQGFKDQKGAKMRNIKALRALKVEFVSYDWRQGGCEEEYEEALKKFGINMYEDPFTEGSDQFSFLLTKETLSDEEVKLLSNDMWGLLVTGLML